MIPVKEVEDIHKLLINTFGGAHGIRDRALLESALSRPFQTFDGKELYTTLISKAASLIESLLLNHPVIDGNKRTGYVITRLFLINSGLDINAKQEEKYEFVIKITSGNMGFDQIAEWFGTHLYAIGG